ncbi:hypothetical protein [Flagellimonas okinawensis]|uniref:Anti-sigma factor n=1 Tax=Flagellimonas okinawensis TaxID=3031324 RepID=A0ABT5XQ79_9FLAO|nr:hypothetical protein [[Muricauda] okinawensis]MDF0708051.1 hypothetical protein [[Muricauda] okinawensis]
MDKLEKHIKEKLEERTIEPSANAWDKIASQVKEPIKRKGNTWFPYAIAASIVGVLFVSIFFFTNKDSNLEQIQVVDTNVEEATETQLPDDETLEIVPSKETDLVDMEPIKTEDNEQFSEPTSNNLIAEQEIKEPLQDEVQLNSDQLIAQKVEEVVAQVELMESVHENVSDAEVDSLLRAAQRQILTDKLFAEGGSVDAMSLLAEVEDELDGSFRDQIFDALKSGYLKVRTAVADRNQ